MFSRNSVTTEWYVRRRNTLYKVSMMSYTSLPLCGRNWSTSFSFDSYKLYIDLLLKRRKENSLSFRWKKEGLCLILIYLLAFSYLICKFIDNWCHSNWERNCDNFITKQWYVWKVSCMVSRKEDQWRIREGGTPFTFTINSFEWGHKVAGTPLYPRLGPPEDSGYTYTKLSSNEFQVDLSAHLLTWS